jgi:hypothetical protein
MAEKQGFHWLKVCSSDDDDQTGKDSSDDDDQGGNTLADGDGTSNNDTDTDTDTDKESPSSREDESVYKEHYRVVDLATVIYLDVLVAVQLAQDGQKTGNQLDEKKKMTKYDIAVFEIASLVEKHIDGANERLEAASAAVSPGFTLLYDQLQEARIGDVRHKIATTAVETNVQGYSSHDPNDTNSVVVFFGKETSVYFLEDFRKATATAVTTTAMMITTIEKRVVKHGTVTKDSAGNPVAQSNVCVGVGVGVWELEPWQRAVNSCGGVGLGAGNGGGRMLLL